MAAKTVLFYDRERKLAQLRAKAWDEGFAEGFAKGKAEGFAKGFAEGKAEAWAEDFALGKAEGRAEAIAEQNRKWQGWFARRTAAEKAGRPFAEPPPAPLS